MFGSFTMDSILQVAFGVKVDSLLEQNNPTIVNAKKVFANLSLGRLIGLTIAIMFPRLGKLLKVGFSDGVLEYFQDFSMEIIKRKREEFATSEVQGKGNTFLELLLEAEAEYETQTKENGGENEEKKSVKCKFCFKN